MGPTSDWPEMPLKPLADRLEADVPCHDLPGMVYRQNGEVIVNGGRCASAFTTPPRLEELDMQKYAQAGFGIGILTKLGSFAYPSACRSRAMPKHGVSFGPSTRWCRMCRTCSSGWARKVFFIDNGFNVPLPHAKELCRALLAAR